MHFAPGALLCRSLQIFADLCRSLQICKDLQRSAIAWDRWPLKPTNQPANHLKKHSYTGFCAAGLFELSEKLIRCSLHQGPLFPTCSRVVPELFPSGSRKVPEKFPTASCSTCNPPSPPGSATPPAKTSQDLSEPSNWHRSHFGSRYKLGCCGHASLLAAVRVPRNA